MTRRAPSAPLRTGWTILALGAVCLSGAVVASQPPAVQPASSPSPAVSADLFESRIRPLLAANCYACHAEAAMGGLRLDSREALMKGSETGAVIDTAAPDDSTFLKVLQHASGYPAMPKGRARLPQADLDLLTAWVRAGAPWPAAATTAATAAAAPRGMTVTAEHRTFWSFQPLRHRRRRRRSRPRPGRGPTSIASCWRASSRKA